MKLTCINIMINLLFLQLPENDRVCSFIQNEKECVMIDACKEDSSAHGKLLIKINKCYK